MTGAAPEPGESSGGDLGVEHTQNVQDVDAVTSLVRSFNGLRVNMAVLWVTGSKSTLQIKSLLFLFMPFRADTSKFRTAGVALSLSLRAALT